MTGRRALALVGALAAAAGCTQSPGGRCDTSADCFADETCDGGVCVPSPAPPGGGGSGGGADPTSFTPVLWSTLQAAPAARFAPAAVSADGATGDVFVAGGLAGPYDPWALSTGAFAARLSGATGALAWAVPFPTLSPGHLRTAAAPGGGLLFAGTADDPTTIGSTTFVPPAGGSLLVGLLDASGAPVWAKEIPNTHATAAIAPVSLAARGGDLLVAGTGAGDFGCPSGDTAAGSSATFAAALSGADGTCRWSRGFATTTVTDLEPRDAGDAAVAGLCTPVGASFDPGGGTSCTKGLFVAVLSGSDGSTTWARTSSGAGTVTAVRDLSVAPSGAAVVVGTATGIVSFGGAAADFGTEEGSFAATFGPTGAPGLVVRPVEAPYAELADAAGFDRCAHDRSGRLWIAGRYYGQPTLGGIRFSACREPTCSAASYLARLDASGNVGSFLPIRAAALPGGGAFAGDLVLFATTGTVAHAERFTGAATVGSTAWSTRDAGLGVLRIVP